MSLYLVKVLVSSLTIVAVTEIAKRAGSFWGGVLASLPLTSVLAFVWLYRDTGKAEPVAALSWNIFWLVLSSLSLFAALPFFLKRGVNFALALAFSIAIMAVAYVITATLVRRFGIQI